MREKNHDGLRYEGAPGEGVTVRVKAQNTVHMVTYSLDGAGHRPLPEGEDISFDLKGRSGDRTTLQLRLDFTSNGSYAVAVENVEGCRLPVSPPGECAQRCLGPDGAVMNFKFFVA